MSDIPTLNSPTAAAIFNYLAEKASRKVRQPLKQAYAKLINGDEEGAKQLIWQAICELDESIEEKHQLAQPFKYRLLRAEIDQIKDSDPARPVKKRGSK